MADTLLAEAQQEAHTPVVKLESVHQQAFEI